MSASEDDNGVLDDLSFLKCDDVSSDKHSGEIIPVLLSNEYLDKDELGLLKALDFSVNNSVVKIGRHIRPELATLIVPNQTNTLVLRAQSKTQFASVLRYIFRGDYTKTDPQNEQQDMQLRHNLFRSIRFHVDMAVLAERYQMADLVKQARDKIFKELERSCSDPYPPFDLIDTIPYIYLHLDEFEAFIKDIAKYAVTNYYAHGLCEREDFQRLLTEHEKFNLTIRSVDMSGRIQSGGSTAPLDIPLTRAQARSRQLEAEIKLEDEEFWEESDEAEHSSEASCEDDLPKIEDLAINVEERENDELLEALIVSAPTSLESSTELPALSEDGVAETSSHEDGEDPEGEWEIVHES